MKNFLKSITPSYACPLLPLISLPDLLIKPYFKFTKNVTKCSRSLCPRINKLICPIGHSAKDSHLKILNTLSYLRHDSWLRTRYSNSFSETCSKSTYLCVWVSVELNHIYIDSQNAVIRKLQPISNCCTFNFTDEYKIHQFVNT